VPIDSDLNCISNGWILTKIYQGGVFVNEKEFFVYASDASYLTVDYFYFKYQSTLTLYLGPKIILFPNLTIYDLKIMGDLILISDQSNFLNFFNI
jgi:hypothetical protein